MCSLKQSNKDHMSGSAAQRAAAAAAREFSSNLRTEHGLTGSSSRGAGFVDEDGNAQGDHGNIEYIFPDEERLIDTAPAPLHREVEPEKTLLELTQGFNRDAACQEIESRVYIIATMCNFISFRLANTSGGKLPILFDKNTRQQLSVASFLLPLTHHLNYFCACILSLAY